MGTVKEEIFSIVPNTKAAPSTIQVGNKMESISIGTTNLQCALSKIYHFDKDLRKKVRFLSSQTAVPLPG